MEIRKTARLILRPWALTDAEAVYEQAHNPKIGAMCGWHPHTSVSESLEIIEHVLRKPHSFAICLEDIPSQCVLEKCGFYTHHTEEHFFSKPTGETHRAVIYALEKA